MVQDGFVPWYIQKIQNILHGQLRMQHELLIIDGHACFSAHRYALRIHMLDDVVPPGEAVFIAVQIEAGYGDLASDY